MVDHRVRVSVDDGFPALVLSSPALLEACILPELGMMVSSLVYGGDELLARFAGPAAYAESGNLFGIPLLHPWANRLARDGFRVAGREISLDPRSPHLRHDRNGLPIHGVRGPIPGWVVEETSAGAEAVVRARLDFAGHPDLLAVFPFPHTLHVQMILRDATLAVTTTIEATGNEAVPVAFGYHPYFQIPRTMREDWLLTLPARRAWGLDRRLLPDGSSRLEPAEEAPLAKRAFDDLFDQIEPGAAFSIAAGNRRVTARWDEGFSVAVVYAPPEGHFVCFEPMTAPNNPFDSGWPITFVQPGTHYRAAFSISIAGPSIKTEL